MDNDQIRRATQRDLTALVALEEECFPTDKLSRKHFQHLLSAKSAEVYVVENQKKLVGSAVLLYRSNSKNARLYSFVIHKDHRARGLAAALNKKLETQAKRKGCDKLILEVRPDNIPAIKFYEKYNYVKFGEIEEFYEDGTLAIRMKKDL